MTRILMLFLLVIVALPVARAQERDDDDGPAPLAGPVFVINEMNFAQWAFGEQDINTIRTRLESYLTLKVDFTDRACGLTDAQKQKLKLAGQGDLKRLWERIEVKRRRYVNVAHDQNKLNEIVQDLQPLRNTATSQAFADGSLFAKTLNATLTSDQVSRYEKAVHEQQVARYRAKTELAIAMLDQTVGFREQQREHLRKLILEETQPPGRFGPQDVQVILVQLAKLPDEKLKPLCDDIQWRLLRRRLDQSRPMEVFLINNGFMPGTGNAAAGPLLGPPRALQPAPPPPAEAPAVPAVRARTVIGR